MTSLATVIGLIPTAMALEKGTEANQPLALAVVGGLTSSTLLSLFLVPVMFMFFCEAKRRNGGGIDDRTSTPRGDQRLRRQSMPSYVQSSNAIHQQQGEAHGRPQVEGISR